MTDLATYRASIKRLFEAEDLDAAFKHEAITPEAARLMSQNKSFRAQRGVKTGEQP